jgi:hypothetical protein
MQPPAVAPQPSATIDNIETALANPPTVTPQKRLASISTKVFTGVSGCDRLEETFRSR